MLHTVDNRYSPRYNSAMAGTRAGRVRRGKVSGVTPMQRKMVAELVKNPDITPTEAARKAGYLQPQSSAVTCMHDPQVIAHLRSVMDKHPDLKTEALVNRLAANLDRKKVEYFSNRGIVKDKREVDDNPHQLKALELCFRLRGDLRPEAAAGDTYMSMTQIIQIVRQSAEERGVQ